MSSTQSAIDRLLALPARGNLLASWQEGDADAVFEAARIAILSHSESNPTQALLAAEHLDRAVGKSLDPLSRAHLDRLLAHALRDNGRVKDSERRYKSAYTTFRRKRAYKEMGQTVVGWVDTLGLLGRAKQASTIARGARELLVRRAPASLARLEANLGNAWYLAGNLRLARASYKKALRYFERHDFPFDASVCAFNLANLLVLDGKLPRARAHYEQAQSTFEQMDRAVFRLRAEYALASLDLVQGKWDTALAQLERVRSELKDLGDLRGDAVVAEEMGRLFAGLGAPELAEKPTAQACSTYEMLGLSEEGARAACVHARILAAMDRHHDASHRFRGAERVWLASKNTRARRLAQVDQARQLIRRGRLADAQKMLRAAQPYLDKHDAGGMGAVCRGLRADLALARGQKSRAADLARAAHRAARRYPATLERPHIAITLARALQASGQPTLAVRWCRKAVGEYEGVVTRLGRSHRAGIEGARSQLYRKAVDVVLAAGGKKASATALDLISVARSPALIEDLLHGQSSRVEGDLRHAITQLRDRILSAGQSGPDDVRYLTLRTEAERLEKRIDTTPKQYPKLVRRAMASRRLEEWAPRLKGRSLVLFDRGERTWRAFIVGPEGVRHVNLPDANDAIDEHWLPTRMSLEALAHVPREFRGSLLDRTRDEAEETLRVIRRAFWRPLELECPMAIVVPAGPLAGLPIEAAAEFEAQGQLPVFTRIPHPALVRADRAKRRERALLLQGMVPGASNEIDAVAASLRTAGYQVDVRSERKDLLEQNERLGVLHVAAHGTIHRRNWMASGIQLGDGWIGFEQLDRKVLEDSLLFFNTCESGLGMEVPGAELDGWMCAGLGAGARELVLSLWKVDDASATALASAFYPGWGSSNAPVAVREARASVREIHPHPFSWAPLVAVGASPFSVERES